MFSDSYLAFAGASFAILMVPGPSTTLVVAYTLSEGRRAIPAIVGGVLAGDLVSLTASMAGIGAVVAASPTLFEVLQWFGVGYLLYLGYRSLRPPKHEAGLDAVPKRISTGALMLRGFLVTAVNPEGLGFFIDFLPQFMNASRPLVPQIVTLGSTFMLLAIVGRLIYAFGAQGARRALSSDLARRRLRWFSGAIMVAAAIWSAVALQHG
jgi:threonine/homoserine/homoserine lactone efflux protein